MILEKMILTLSEFSNCNWQSLV